MCGLKVGWLLGRCSSTLPVPMDGGESAFLASFICPLEPSSERSSNPYKYIITLLSCVPPAPPTHPLRRRCESGCECQPKHLQGHHKDPVSQTYLMTLSVSQHQECVVTVTVHQATESGEHKVKISGVMFGSGYNFADDYAAFMLQYQDGTKEPEKKALGGWS